MSVKRKLSIDGDVWEDRRDSRKQALRERHYVVFAAPGREGAALSLQEKAPDRFAYLPIEWAKFKDGTDCIKISGFSIF